MNTSHDRRSAALSRALALAATLGTMGLAGCQPGPRTSPAVAPVAGREIVISDSDIVRMGARTAWDAVRMRVPRLTFSRDASGRPTSVRIQETRSANASETPLVVVDGAQVPDIGYLREIQAAEIRSIRVIDGEAAQQLYGLSAASGAIVVLTKQGP
jgi:hypothetical protein